METITIDLNSWNYPVVKIQGNSVLLQAHPKHAGVLIAVYPSEPPITIRVELPRVWEDKENLKGENV